DAGFEAHRVPLSGAVREYPGDLMIDVWGAEVKCRGGGSGFTLLERWLGKNDLLFLRRDRSEPMVVLSWTTWARLAEEGLGKRGGEAARSFPRRAECRAPRCRLRRYAGRSTSGHRVDGGGRRPDPSMPARAVP